MTTQPIIYVLLSGGVDSATALARACQLDATGRLGVEVRCVSIDYGQRHLERELEAAANLAERYDCEHVILKMPMGRTMLTDPTIVVPDVSYDEIVGVSPTYVPFRNGLMLSLLASYIAGRHLDAQSSEPEFHCVNILIYWGAHAEDAAGGAYPDCTAEFVGAMACAIDIGTAHFVRLVAPFVAMSKAEVVAYGATLGVPYDLTWSCYRGGDLHCGTCPTCRARRSAFRNGGVIDPTKYAA